MLLSNEYDTFQYIAEGLRQAQSGARRMAQLRSDQRDLWLKMAEVYGVSLNSLYKLAEEGLAKQVKS